jgi:hypothetical protein
MKIKYAVIRKCTAFDDIEIGKFDSEKEAEEYLLSGKYKEVSYDPRSFPYNFVISGDFYIQKLYSTEN